ncbi:FHA domain-containing protein [Dactylosporangium sp. CA-139066]|uniref:FHA domain-containing protein n=1 Tax=Dactylosporangium sp. CA-139066 TaxID=3239930 RepID=UPI003D8D217E
MTTYDAAYAPGDWLAIAESGLWLIADLDPNDPLAAECWALAVGGAPLERLAALLRSAERPVSFAAACLESAGVGAIARGGAVAEIVGADGRTETVRDDAGGSPAARPAARFRLAGTRPATGDGRLPIVAGMVLAAELTAVLRTDAEMMPAPQTGTDPTPLAAWPPPAAPEPSPGITWPPPAPEPAPAATWPPPAPGPVTMWPPPDPAPVATWPQHEPAPVEAGTWPPAADAEDGDPTRYDAMFGFAAPAVAPVEEFPETVAVPVVRPEPEPAVGHTTMRPATPHEAPADDFIDVDSLGWLSTAAPPPMVVPPTVAPPPAPPALEPAPDELILTTVRGGRAAPVPGPLVDAVSCPAGHLDDPGARECRVCRAQIQPQSPTRVNRPPLGVLRLSTGDSIALDRNVVLGRAPGGPSGSGAGEPHYVKLPSPYHDISRRHVEIRLDGWSVVAVDLDSRNGTFVEQPGERAVELPRGGACRLRNGAVIGLTEDVSIRFEAAG